MNPDEFSELRYKVGDGVASLRLDRAEHLNAFSSRLYEELKWALRAAGSDETVDVVVLTGAGRAFATGGDLKEARERLESGDPLSLYAFVDNLPWAEFRQCPKVVIGAVHGLCLAGGVITAASCDITIAGESATFGLTEGRVGLADAVAPALLASRLSTAKLRYLLFTGKEISAREAERIGLVTEVVPDDSLDARVAEVVAEVRRTSPLSRRLFKQCLNQLEPVPTDPGVLLSSLNSPDTLEALRAFSQGRTP
ncbi:MAG: enoyl-CoA hydratase/isomerase family protein [Actinomycetota bacterium]|jgi:enoyl-CoA hydratase/carnithine racemase